MSPQKNDYDLLVVSASPLMLLEALKQKMEGKSVLVVDDRERIGGAWYVKDLFGYKNVEVGCHFIYNNNDVYSFLDRIDAFKLEVMQPQPSVIITGLNHKGRQGKVKRFSARMRELVFKDKNISCRRLQLVSGVRETVQKRKIRFLFSGIKNYLRYTPYKYFKKGCGEFMANMQKLIDRENLEIVFNTRIRDLKVKPGQHGTTLINDKEIVFRNVLLSKHVKFDSLTITDRIEYERQPWRKKHFVLHIEGKIIRPFTYVDVVNDAVLKRVSDVGIYCDGISENRILICSDTTEEVDANNENETIKDLIFERLKQLKFISQDSILLEYFVEKFISDYTPTEKIKELFDISGGVITSVDTSDLGKSIKLYNDRWNSVITKQV